MALASKPPTGPGFPDQPQGQKNTMKRISAQDSEFSARSVRLDATYFAYQQELARCLVTAIGVEAAIACARRQNWNGVIAHILSGNDAQDAKT